MPRVSHDAAVNDLAQGSTVERLHDLQLVADTLPTLISFVTRDLRYRFANSAYERWFGVVPQRIAGMHLRDVVGAQTYEQIWPHIEAALAGKTVNYSTPVRYPDGIERHVEATHIPHLDETGAVEGFVTLVSDISARKRLEDERARAALRSERLMRITAAIADAVGRERVIEAIVDKVALVLDARVALWLADGAGRTLTCARSAGGDDPRSGFSRISVEDPRSPLATAFREQRAIWADEMLDPAHAVTLLNSRAHQRTACLPVVIGSRAFGCLVFELAQPRSLDDEDDKFLALVVRCAGQALERLRLYEADQRGRARAELLYEMAESVIRCDSSSAVFEAALDAIARALDAPRASILVFDDDGVMRFKAWRGLSDEYRAAVEGHSPWTRDTRAPQPIFVTDAETEPTLTGLLPTLRREGIAALGFIPLLADGQVIGKFMVYYEKPRELSAAELDLAQAIANHVSAAIVRFSALAELERAVRFSEMFTGILGHDLRNPLNAMMMAAQLALTRDGSEKLAKPLTRILSSGERMARMIEQLLDFTRIRVSGGIPIDARSLDVVPVIRQVMDELDLANSEWTLSLGVAGTDTHGLWDADRLSQVFSNLVANAVQHGSAAHGVRVFVDARDARILRVTVHNGGAIPDAVRAHLFEPMNGGQHRDNTRGLGLGLYITRQIVAAHGGQIDVRSSDSEGTTFSVVLPRTRV